MPDFDRLPGVSILVLDKGTASPPRLTPARNADREGFPDFQA
jgi:hypothetical protein